MKRLFSAAVLSCLALCVAGWPSSARGMSSAPSDAQVKAAMVYNLAKFLDWPGETFPGNSVPLTICWLGNGPLVEELQAIDGKLVRNRPVVVRQARPSGDIGECKILVIDESQRPGLPEIIGLAKTRHIFTISDMQGFAAAGGMLGFTSDAGKIRFQVNLDSVKSSGITVSSQVLNLAVIVTGAGKQQ